LAALTPQITLTATLDDINGAPVPKGKITICLCGFGAIVPVIQGTAMLARTGPVEYTLLDGTLDAGILLWGNDVITPLNQTYYSITVEDAKKNVVQCGAYQFTGSGTIDLSNAPQINPGIGTPPLQYATADIWLIQPTTIVPPPGSGIILAPAGTVYTLTRSAFFNKLLGLYYNGTLLIPFLHYTLVLRTMTLTFTTIGGDNLYASYVATTLD
jgi:hypothetical protein